MMRRPVTALLRTVVSLAVVIGPWSGAARAESILPKWHNNRLAVNLPISWEVTRSDFRAEGIATETESYREIWTITVGPGFQLELASPRARVPVGGVGQRKRTDGLPSHLVLNEREFARLIGFSNQTEGDELASADDDLVFLRVMAPNPAGESVTLHLSKNEFFSVHMVVGR